MLDSPTPRVICILGMHRSGTSLTARLLNLLGVYLGPKEHMIQPGPDNPQGFWEHQFITELNNEILARLDSRSWDPAPTFPSGWESSSKFADLRSKARSIIAQDFNTSLLWGWKDPRNCLTLPFWKKLLPSMKFVICLRNPIDVARSLEERDRLPFEKSIELWFRYTTAAIEQTAGEPRLFVFYEDYFDNWRRELRRLANFVGVPTMADDQDVLLAAEKFIDRELWHHRTSLLDIVDNNKLFFPAKALYISLRALIRIQLGTPYGNHLIDAMLDDIISSLSQYTKESQHNQEVLLTLLKQQQAQISQLQEVIAQRERALQEWQERSHAQQAQISQLQEVIAQRERALQEWQERSHAQQAQISQLQEVIAQRERALQEWQERSHAQQAQISQLQEVIAQRERALQEWQERSHAQQAQISQLQEVIAQRERALQEWQERSHAQQAQISQLQEVIAQRERALQEWQERSHAQQAQISQLQEVIAQRERALQEWQERSHAQQAQISQLQADLQRLWNSKSWRLTAPLRVIYGVLLQTRAWLKVQTILIAKKILPKPVKRSIKKAIGWEEEELAIPPPATTKVIAVEQTPWKKGRPLVSVIIPCYNYGHYVEEAIDSVLQQTFQNFEIIVVNDGSTDPVTIEVLKHLKKPKTRVIHQANKGLPEARNEGIRHAEGKYICCLDADDTLEPTYLEKAVALLEANPGIAFAYSWVRLFGDEEKIWYTEPYDLEKLLRYNHISVASVFRYDAWKQVGGYCSEMRQGYEDWEFWIRLGSHGFRGQLIPEALFNHRRHGRTMTHEAQERHQKLVADIARRNQALFANPSLVKNIQRTYFDSRVNHPFLNLNDPKDFRQGDARPSLLILVPWLQIGGAETVLYQVMSGLQQLFRFYLFTTLPDKNEWHDRFYQLTKNIYHLPNFLPEYAWEDFLVNFIHTRDIQQVLISHSEFGYSILPKLKESFPNVRTVDLLHNDSDLGFFRHSVQYDSYLDLHIVVNELIKQKLHAMGKVDLAKVYTIYNAIDEEKVFNPALYQPEKVRERWQLPPGKKVVTYIGRLSREKQPDHFLRLASKLKHRSDLFFLLVGDGPLRDIVEAEIKQLGLQEHLRWYKMVSPEQIPEILAGTDLMVLTSEVEGFPMVVLEALAMGVPVISYDVGDVRSVVQSGVNGFIIPPQQHELLVQKVSEVLSDESMLEGLRKRARVVLIERGFTLERMIKQYQEVLVPR
jgi:glycosyltransferase involved in cell wall biosynthesis/GT2 family glycosyltransferase